MARGTNKFRQREITRTIKAAKAAGEKVERVEIETDGKIVVHIVGAGGDNPKRNTADAVLERLKKHEHGKA
jgi:hypothetical protein